MTDSHSPGCKGLDVFVSQMSVVPSKKLTVSPAPTASAPRLQTGTVRGAAPPVQGEKSDAPTVGSEVDWPLGVPGTFWRKLLRPGCS
ncbi:MAG TPA: hypothetical protein PLI95_31580 [Polyangiaceae bacterium]|nr:hypothetical protein [Polyangiaceae bacterium]